MDNIYLPTQEKLTPPPKTRKNPPQTQRRGFRAREFGGHTQALWWGLGGIWAEGENRGGMGRSARVVEFNFYLFFFPT